MSVCPTAITYYTKLPWPALLPRRALVVEVSDDNCHQGRQTTAGAPGLINRDDAEPPGLLGSLSCGSPSVGDIIRSRKSLTALANNASCLLAHGLALNEVTLACRRWCARVVCVLLATIGWPVARHQRRRQNISLYGPREHDNFVLWPRRNVFSPAASTITTHTSSFAHCLFRGARFAK